MDEIYARFIELGCDMHDMTLIQSRPSASSRAPPAVHVPPAFMSHVRVFFRSCVCFCYGTRPCDLVMFNC